MEYHNLSSSPSTVSDQKTKYVLGHTVCMNKGSNVEEISDGESHGKLAYPDGGKTVCSLPKYPD